MRRAVQFLYVLRFTFYATLLLACVLRISAAAPDLNNLPPASTNRIEFVRDIQPILETSCLRCHGPEKPKSGFRMDSREAVLKGGAIGKSVLPGDSANSLLIHYVAGLVEDMEMPPTGKGDPLTPAQIATLRAWIDQDLPWGGAAPVVGGYSFDAVPVVRWITVSGDEKKFREHHWIREGWDGGLDRFDFTQKLKGDAKFTASGRLLQDDYRVTLSIEKPKLGYVHAGFQQYRKYFDDSGGYYRPFTPSLFSLDRDLHLDKGQAWIEVGGAGPFETQVELGYEYHYSDGEKSTTQWLPVFQGGTVRNIYPSAKEIDERLHVIRANVSKEWAALRLEDDFRYEFYDLDTTRTTAAFNAAPTTSSVLRNREGTSAENLVNAFRFEKVFTDYFLTSGGYLYVHTDADDSFDQQPFDANGAPTTGRIWHDQGITLSSEAHVFNFNVQLGPWKDFTLTAGAQMEWSRQDSFGSYRLDELVSDNPPVIATNSSTGSSDIDRFVNEQKATLRYTRIPFTALYAEGRWRQEDVGEQGDSLGGSSEPFLLRRDVHRDWQDYRVGFNVSPWSKASLNAWYQYRDRHTDFDEKQDELFPGIPNNGYPGFIRERDTFTDEVGARLVLRPRPWLRTTLAYRLVATDFDAVTDATTTSPGGRIQQGNYDASIYSFNVVLTPWQRLRWFTSLTFQDAQTKTAEQTDAVVHYAGQTISVLNSATYFLNEKTDLTIAYDFSSSDYRQNNEAAGLPLGIEYRMHSLRAGVSRAVTKWLRTSLEYAWYLYDEPSSGHANDYAAHGIFAMARIRWE
jgi:mono/diheme cytochrome c family protein